LVAFVRVKKPQTTPKSPGNIIVAAAFAISISMVVLTGGVCISYAMILQTLAKAAARSSGESR
jgi:formate/nitrite transporter FocA (FNT family)